MISLTCTHCKQVLKIDDAFAGGVCRCQHCGTIQTVPVHLKEGGTPSSGAVASAGGKVKAQKALYQHKSKSGTGAPVQGSGLDELAQIVASSGLGGSGLTRGSLRGTSSKKAPQKSTPDQKKKLMFMIVGGAVSTIIAVSVLVYLLVGRSSDGGSSVAPSPQPGGNPTAVNSPTGGTPRPVAGPTFAGMSIAGKSVVYVIDRGGGTKDAFSDVLELTFKSVETLGSDRKFQILLWDNGTEPVAYPAVTLSSATPENAAEARTKLQDAYAFGQSEYQQALSKAFARAPDAVVIATGKAFELDDAFLKAVDAGRGSAPIKVYTLAINGSGGSNVLQKVAQKTGGAYVEMSTSQLRALNQ